MDLVIFFVDLVLIVLTFGAAFVVARIGHALRTGARAASGTLLMFGLLAEFSLFIILGEHFLERYKSH